MVVHPHVMSKTFQDLKPRHLFVANFREGGGEDHNHFCIRCFALSEDGKEFPHALILGPDLPEHLGGISIAEFNDDRPVIDFGTDYCFHLEGLPATVQFMLPGVMAPGTGIVVTNERRFLRANSGNRAPNFSACFVDLDTGEISYNPPNEPSNMVTGWSLRLSVPEKELRAREAEPLVSVRFDPVW